MIEESTKIQPIKPAMTLWALAISAFGIGSTEFISVGLLPLIVQDLHVSLSSASLTVSLYALGVTIGAPILTALTSKWERKRVLLFDMTIFLVGNLLAAIAPNFAFLLVGRIVAALAHGVFMSIAAVIAADVVAPAKRASAIALMFTGLTVATITGVPIGTFIGQHTTWRMSFVFILVIGLIALLGNILLVPNNLAKSTAISLRDIGKVLTNLRLLLILLITALGYGGTFVVYTYVAPILEKFMGYSPSQIVLILIGYGGAVAIGNMVGGRLANHRSLRALLYMFIGLAFSILGIFFFIHQPILGLGAILLMGLFAFMNVPGLQLLAVKLAEKYLPAATSMASALNISAFNIGITMGAFVGGKVTARGGLALTPIFGFVMVMAAVGIKFAWLMKDKVVREL
ncbi:MFS transporter [Periweissella cryptocerci]|uniref:MFS transporter n=1 Tax=Periweissella cryptocerci TaxID=2506420 RepID=A0A4P6YX79_9LACO|nr:MFS transporter [Periweissella cryptocerci]